MKSIVWIVTRLQQVGGGEKLLFEGVRHYRERGFDVHIITWHFDPKCLFDGEYENKNIHVLGGAGIEGGRILDKAWSRARSIFAVRKLVREISPELVICQSEYDVVLARLATAGTNIPYSVLIFGQTFQFPKDHAKYSLIFRRHLREIVQSFAGYRDTIPLAAPRLSLLNRLANEVICLVRYFAVRQAAARFTFSKQVQWEVGKLYGGVRAHVLKGAFRQGLFEFRSDRAATRRRYGVPHDSHLLVSMHRLEAKKRTQLIVHAFARLLEAEPEAMLLIAGTGPERAEIERMILELGLQNRVKMLGYVPEPEAAPLKQACDLFVSMDIADFDISPFEALALGARALWSAENDMDENMSRFRNIHRSEPELGAVAAAMSAALATPPAGEDERRAAVERYSWGMYFDSILEHSLEFEVAR
jgi:glycosyltransferase involved in cell wall biosynthesis